MNANVTILLSRESVGGMSFISSIGLPDNVRRNEVGGDIDAEVSVFSEGGEVVLIGRDDGASDG